MTAMRSPARSTNSSTARPPPALRSPGAITPTCSAPASATASCADPKRAMCACTSTGRWKRACKASTGWCSAASTKAPGRRETRSDPWLSRPMRRALGLDLPERRIGLSAHDFAQSLGAARGDPCPRRQGRRRADGDVALRAAARRGRRRSALGRRAHARRALSRAWPAHSTTRRRSKPAARAGADAAAAARPRALSVTEIEDWLRDPYTIYAKHILRLLPLDPVDTAPGARDRGTRDPCARSAIHPTVRAGAARRADEGIDRARREAFRRAWSIIPEARAFWWPRFRAHRRAGSRIGTANAAPASPRCTPRSAARSVSRPATRDFTLSAAPTASSGCNDGSYAILDYKTGQARTEKQVRTGLAPQLTLEAAILRARRIRRSCRRLDRRDRLRHAEGRRAGRQAEPIEFKDGTPDSQADHALAKLTRLAAQFEDAATPYRSLVLPMWTHRYGDYDHLARVKEWSAPAARRRRRNERRAPFPSRCRRAAGRGLRPGTSPPSCRPMPAPARPTCWRSA